jgi:hypothetical protein
MMQPLSIMLGVAGALALCACTNPKDSGVQVIVGAHLAATPGREAIEYSVVVISDGRFRAVGPQSAVPVPKGSTIIRGSGMTISPVPGGESIEPGHAANLVLEGAGSLREMRNGDWVH